MIKPLVFIIAAQSVDGFIAKDSEHLTGWTSKEDKELFRSLTLDAGVVVMGSKTFQTLPEALPGRKNVIYTNQVLEVDTKTTDLTHLEPARLIEKLAAEGFSKIAVIGGQQIYDLFLQSGVVDEIYLTVEPVLFGKGMRLTFSPHDRKLDLIESSSLGGQSVLLHYKVSNEVDHVAHS